MTLDIASTVAFGKRDCFASLDAGENGTPFVFNIILSIFRAQTHVRLVLHFDY
jgi:hypothetical protein